ncbi:NAD(P)H-dependent oxidoreductase [Roseomonas hellenica]|uniref:NAD(P)H-dependent oxidoreductase n=1 Tax=Plastoroseomonas hellenica TaxID=2687306 RepID=A0ABS5EX96_9PROT|nr:NAD(P)H-dependent oxidoreductase [Plastoroseomonas hellenica]MBR0664909.1 NAD(P)H-dependent oxidoreductase [Plastoroseomonas hellenica]
MALKLNIIIASTRPGRGGPTVAEWVHRYAKENSSFDVDLIDLVDFELPLLDEPAHPAARKYEHEHTKRWSESVGSADAFLFVTPEYDYFVPASLVNAIQCLFHEWSYKPAAIVSYGGVSGGLRGSQELRQLLGNLNVVAINQPVPVPFYSQFIGDDGVFGPNDAISSGTNTLLGELHKWALALRPMRTPVASAV